MKFLCYQNQRSVAYAPDHEELNNQVTGPLTQNLVFFFPTVVPHACMIIHMVCSHDICIYRSLGIFTVKKFSAMRLTDEN